MDKTRLQATFSINIQQSSHVFEITTFLTEPVKRNEHNQQGDDGGEDGQLEWEVGDMEGGVGMGICRMWISI